jgi:hypothetical protein
MPADRNWISLNEAARRLEVSPPVVRRLVDRGALTCRELPGCHPRVSVPDLTRLVSEHTRPAAPPIPAA